MPRPLRFLWALVFLGLIFSQAFAAQVIVTRKANLRSDPSTKHPPLVSVFPPEDLELINSTPSHGYYHVRTSDNQEGWIYGRSVHLVQDTAPANTPTHPSSNSVPTTTSTTDRGVSGTIPSNWDKATPNDTQFEGADGTCGPSGDGGDAATNVRKNRTDVPASYHVVTWKALQSLPYPVAGKSLADWTPQQLAEIQPYEGVPVSVVGYLTAIKVEDKGSGESTNCHFTNATEVDWHMPLVEQAGQAEATAIVVETTPRVRQSHPRWTPTALAAWVNAYVPVRISGWTLLDPEHRAHLGRYRSTLWEVHPITQIEVFKDGQWVDVDQLP